MFTLGSANMIITLGILCVCVCVCVHVLIDGGSCFGSNGRIFQLPPSRVIYAFCLVILSPSPDQLHEGILSYRVNGAHHYHRK